MLFSTKVPYSIATVALFVSSHSFISIWKTYRLRWTKRMVLKSLNQNRAGARENLPHMLLKSLAVNKVLTILAFDSLRTILDSNWRFSLLGYNSTVFLIRFVSFCRPSISPLHTRSLNVRDLCHIHLLPNIWRKGRRDIDDSLGLSALTLRSYTCTDETIGKFCCWVSLQIDRRAAKRSTVKFSRVSISHVQCTLSLGADWTLITNEYIYKPLIDVLYGPTLGSLIGF